MKKLKIMNIMLSLLAIMIFNSYSNEITYLDFTDQNRLPILSMQSEHAISESSMIHFKLTEPVQRRDTSITPSNTQLQKRQYNLGDQMPCGIGGKRADETGEKVWCWKDIILPEYSGSTGVSFSNEELSFASECDEKSVTKSGNKLRFDLKPMTPITSGKSWCTRDYNMRAEIRTAPWPVRHPKGTEEWFGWNYTFGDDYVIDQDNEWLFFQVHNGILGKTPLFELMISNSTQYEQRAGEIYIINNANYPDIKATGIVPVAGQTFKIVIHVIWGDASNGLLQVWIDEKSVYGKEVRTVFSDTPWGGNAKWGIYKWPWIEKKGVQKSLDQGISHLETYLGPVRMITRYPGDPDYGKYSYLRVAP